MNSRSILFSLWVACMAQPSVSEASDISDHLFTQIKNEEVRVALSEIPDLLVDGAFDAAVDKGTEIEKRLDDSSLGARERAQVLTNLSIYLSQADKTNLALGTIGEASELLESISPFDHDLYHVLMAKGYILAWENQSVEAEDALRHAQHIAHRNQGVYALDQVPALRLLADVQISKGRPKAADQTQRFFLKVNEQNYGVGSEELIPSLMEVGEYFANRGYTIPSDQARTPSVFMVGRNRTVEMPTPDSDVAYRSKLFREAEIAYIRSINIIRDKYGPADLRLAEPLKGLARSKFLQGNSGTYAEQPMEQMVSIVLQNPGADAADKAKALVDLGDLYVKTTDARALETYRQAWRLIEGQQHEELRYELFGKPKRLLPELNFNQKIARYPVGLEPDQQLFVTLNYNVTRDGKVRQVDVVDSNISLKDQKKARRGVQAMKFRPRLVDGEPVMTENLSLRQSYAVRNPAPVFNAEMTTGP